MCDAVTYNVEEAGEDSVVSLKSWRGFIEEMTTFPTSFHSMDEENNQINGKIQDITKKFLKDIYKCHASSIDKHKGQTDQLKKQVVAIKSEKDGIEEKMYLLERKNEELKQDNVKLVASVQDVQNVMRDQRNNCSNCLMLKQEIKLKGDNHQYVIQEKDKRISLLEQSCEDLRARLQSDNIPRKNHNNDEDVSRKVRLHLPPDKKRRVYYSQDLESDGKRRKVSPVKTGQSMTIDSNQEDDTHAEPAKDDFIKSFFTGEPTQIPEKKAARVLVAESCALDETEYQNVICEDASEPIQKQTDSLRHENKVTECALINEEEEDDDVWLSSNKTGKSLTKSGEKIPSSASTGTLSKQTAMMPPKLPQDTVKTVTKKKEKEKIIPMESTPRHDQHAMMMSPSVTQIPHSEEVTIRHVIDNDVTSTTHAIDSVKSVGKKKQSKQIASLEAEFQYTQSPVFGQRTTSGFESLRSPGDMFGDDEAEDHDVSIARHITFMSPLADNLKSKKSPKGQGTISQNDSPMFLKQCAPPTRGQNVIQSSPIRSVSNNSKRKNRNKKSIDLNQTTMTQVFDHISTINDNMHLSGKSMSKCNVQKVEDHQLKRAIELSLKESQCQSTLIQLTQKQAIIDGIVKELDNDCTKDEIATTDGAVIKANSPSFKKPRIPKKILLSDDKKGVLNESNCYDPDVTCLTKNGAQSNVMTRVEPVGNNSLHYVLDTDNTLDDTGFNASENLLAMHTNTNTVCSDHKTNANDADDKGHDVTFNSALRIIEEQTQSQKVEEKGAKNVTWNDSFDRVPKKANSPEYAHVTGAIRKKIDRIKLDAFDCKECQEYYKDMNLDSAEKKKRMKQCSRHRAKYKPPTTPPHFWDLGFPTTQQCKDRGYVKEDEGQRISRVRRNRPYNQLFLTKDGTN